MIRRHLTPALLAFAPLLVCCLIADRPVPIWWAACGAGVLCAALSCTLAVTRINPRAGVLLMGAAAGCLLGALSLQRAALERGGAFLPAAAAEVSELTGTVTRDSVLTREGDTVVHLGLEQASSSLRGISGRARGGVLVFVAGDHRFSIGERLLVRAVPTPWGKPGLQQWVARARLGDVRSREGGALWTFRARARAWLHRSVSRAGYPASTLMDALLIGAREDISPDLHERFRRSGSLHILALSGLHVTAVFGAMAGLLWFLPRRWQRFAGASLALLFYQFLAGFTPSLLRATVMILVGGVALLRDRDSEPLNVLALSGILLLMIDPFQALTVSFQLSFLALAGILAFGALIRRPLESRLPRVLLMALAMSAGAQAATLPLVLARFSAWYPSGLLAALALVPLTTGYLWASLAWLAVSLVPWQGLQMAFAWVLGRAYDLLRLVAGAFAQVPGLEFPEGVPAAIVVGAAAAGLLAATALPLKLKRA